MGTMANGIQVIAGLALPVNILLVTLGPLIFLTKGISSGDSEIRSACFSAAKGGGLSLLLTILLLPFVLTIGLGFQANTSLGSLGSFLSLNLLIFVVAWKLMIGRYFELR